MRVSDTLPVTSAPVADAPPRAVLVVDDDAQVLAIVAAQLESDGWRVATAGGIADARAVLHADPTVAVVVCDIHLAAESGFDMAAALTELRPEQLATEIVFITGSATSETVIEALRHKAFDLVRKPVRRAELLKCVGAAGVSAAHRRQQQAMLDQIEQRLAESEETKQRLALALRDAEVQNLALSKSSSDARHDLLAVISHELKTPLIPIVGLADLMLNSPELTFDEIQEFAGMIRDGSERLGAIIDQTLTYLDAERQQARAEKRDFLLAALIDAALRKLSQDKGPDRFDIACPVGLQAWGAPDLLADALAALLDNALKASPGGARLRIAASQNPEGRVVVEVADSGPGLPESVRRNIGVPFLVGDASLSRSWPGVGLGLACARKIARLNGGDLDADPAPGPGARLRLLLSQKPRRNRPRVTAGGHPGTTVKQPS